MLQLEAKGLLKVGDSVRKHLPTYPSAVADKITIQQLLDHRSGMGDIFGPAYDAAPPAKLRELSDYVPLFAGKPLDFAPGTSDRYSNAGYILLGLIIEKHSGMKYRHYLQKNIFGPAGMKSSGLFALDEAVAKRATGYTKRGPEGPLDVAVVNLATLPGRGSSAGGAYSTAHDLIRYFDAVDRDALVKAAVGSTILRKGMAALAVGGGAPGLNAAVERMDGWTVVVMANVDPPAARAVARAASILISGEDALRLRESRRISAGGSPGTLSRDRRLWPVPSLHPAVHRVA